jgi:hypothetical protein
MQNSTLQDLTETLWRRPLAPAEEARLRRHLDSQPRARQNWEADAALTRNLNHLAAAPVSSNFTALVLQAARRAPAEVPWSQRLAPAFWFPAGWLARLATAAAMICLSLFTIREYQFAQRQKISRDLAGVSRLAALPPVDWLQNFDTIDRLNRVKVADDDLLAVLQ